MVESIIKSFDIWTDAQGVKSRGRVKSIDNISLEGIAHLRELILQLAVRGKLVSQDPRDEPASKLLENIEKEKAKLIKDGKIKKEKSLTQIKQEEKPFELHNGWEWVRLQQIIQISSGDGLTSTQMRSDGKIPVYGGNGISGYHSKANVTKPTIVIGRVGFYCGSIHVTPRSAWVTDNAFITYFSEENIDLNFLAWLLKGTNLKENDSATAQPVISGRKVYPIVVGLPPLPEQHRIVAKVEELMALCYALEKEKTASLKTHQTLVAALLQTLIAAKDAEEVEMAWHRLAPHFDTLFCTEDSIDQLKQTILQLAIMGCLVKQDPNDEPASELLKKIAKQKEKLIKEGKIKKEKPLPEIKDEEKPFALPDGWQWVRLSNLCELITKGSSPKWQGVSYVDNENEVLFITSENVGSFKMLLENRKYVEKKFNEVEPRSILRQGDFLMNIVGGSIGRTAVFNIPDLANINQAVCLIRAFYEFLDPKYLLCFFNSETCISYMFDKQVDNARANLSMGNIAKFVIPIPPIDEQRKIVAKVKELTALCDNLKDRLLKSQEIQNTLSRTIVERAIV